MAGTERTVSILGIFKDAISAPLTKVSESAQGVAKNLDRSDEAAGKFVGKIARLGQRLLSIQVAFQNLSQSIGGVGGGGSGLRASLDAAGAGLSTFAGIVALFPNPVGLAVGAVAGLTAGLASFASSAGSSSQEAERFVAQVKQIDEVIRGRKSALAFSRLTGRGPLDEARVEAEQAEEVLRTAVRAKTLLEGGRNTTTQDLERVNDQFDRALRAFREADEILKHQEGLKRFTDEMKRLGDEAFEVQDALNDGLIGPLEAVTRQFEIARKQLKLTEQNKGLFLTEEDAKIAIDRTAEALELASIQKQITQDVAEQEKIEKQIAEWKRQQTQETKKLSEIELLVKGIAEGIGQAFAQATATLIDGLLEGTLNFKQFAAQFLRQIGIMIAQALVLKAVMAGLGVIGVPGVNRGGYVVPGGVIPFAGGGPVPGPDVNRDVVPAVLTPGEYVVNRKAVETYGVGVMSALNRRLIPRSALDGFSSASLRTAGGRFAEGGEVVSPTGGQTAPVNNVLVADEEQFARLLRGGTPALLRWMESHSETLSAMLARRRI